MAALKARAAIVDGAEIRRSCRRDRFAQTGRYCLIDRRFQRHSRARDFSGSVREPSGWANSGASSNCMTSAMMRPASSHAFMTWKT